MGLILWKGYTPQLLGASTETIFLKIVIFISSGGGFHLEPRQLPQNLSCCGSNLSSRLETLWQLGFYSSSSSSWLYHLQWQLTKKRCSDKQGTRKWKPFPVSVKTFLGSKIVPFLLYLRCLSKVGPSSDGGKMNKWGWSLRSLCGTFAE